MASPSDSNKQTASPSAWEKSEQKFVHKPASEYFDPCQEFADRSLKCMKRNAFDRDMCGDYFQAYRDCKKQWLLQKKKGSSS